jgi:ABC-type dipeptide/oligopeptide/nickel transport system ATPase component
MMALLDVRHLTVRFESPGSSLTAVDDLNLSVAAGETLGVVGESGSGKSVTALALLRLLQPPGRVTAGAVFFEGRDLLTLPESEMRAIRGARISLIFQEPMTALNPVMRVGDQIAEALTVHGTSRRDANRRALELLGAVHISDADRRMRDFPHQLSGGMRLVRPTPEGCDEFLRDIRLLDARELRSLFPRAKLWRERFLGMTKSLIAVKQPD